MVALLDVNLLIALAWPNHVHHSIAQEWFRKNQAKGWATCPVVQAGFVRVSSNSSAIPGAKTPAEAFALLSEITALRNHVFWKDDVRLDASKLVARARVMGYRQVTDAHLLGVALRHKGRLATLDGGIRNLVPDGFAAEEVVCVITEA